MDNTWGHGTGSAGSDDERKARWAQSFSCNVRRFPLTPPWHYQSDEPPALVASPVPGTARRGDEEVQYVTVPPITPAALKAMLSGGGVYYDPDENGLPGRVIYYGGWSRA